MLKTLLRHTLAATTLLAAGLAATTAHAQVRDHTFKLSFAIAGDNAQSRSAAFFKSEVERLSGGKMKVQLFPGSQLGPDLQVLSGLRAGAIEAQIGTTSLLGSIDPAFNLYDIPFLFRSFDEVYAVADGEPGKRFAAIGEKNGFILLNTHSGVWRNLTNRSRPVASAADIKGLKIRTLQNTVFIDFWKALGANPVAIPFPELYSALEGGTVDGQENANGVTVFGKLMEVQKHFTPTQHGAYVGVVLFSGPVWARLNEDERKVLREAGASSGAHWRKGFAEEDVMLNKRIAEKLTVTPLSPAARADLEKLAQPVIDKHLATFDPALVQQVRAAIAKVRQ